MTTPLMELDIKSIRKINNTYLKYIRSGKEIYILEIYNILYVLKNSLDLQNAKEFVLYYLEDDIRLNIIPIIEKIK